MAFEVTDFLREELREPSDGDLTVTVVSVAHGWASSQEGVTEGLSRFERLALVTYD